MKLFSQRKGLKPIGSVIQVDSMDKDLRNRLWNALTIIYWDKAGPWLSEDYNKKIRGLCHGLWHLYFGKTIDVLEDSWQLTLAEIRDYFLSMMTQAIQR